MKFEDVGYNAEASSGELDETSIQELTEKLNRDGAMPDGVLSILEVTYSADDSVYENGIDEDGNDKVFVSVTLLYPEGVEEAGIEVPSGLLAKIADGISPGIDLEGNWELVDSEAYQAPPTP